MVRLLLGIGNPDRGDDGAGMYVAGLVRDPGWVVFSCGTVPEMFSGKVRAHQPEILVLVDAAEMGLLPGEFRRIPPEKVSGFSGCTHSLPLAVVMEYLRPFAGRMILIGIQPGSCGEEDRISEPVRTGAARLAGIIGSGSVEEIPEL